MKYTGFIILFLFICAWSILLLFVSPDRIVQLIGIENTYLVAFLLAVCGGLSTVTSASFFAAVATFAGGGAHPILLGISGGLGIFISDCIFFYLAKRGVEISRVHDHPFAKRVAARLQSLPAWSIPLGIYVYLGFTPLPNDLLMIALALAKVPFMRFAYALFFGSITIVTVTAYLGWGLF